MENFKLQLHRGKRKLFKLRMTIVSDSLITDNIILKGEDKNATSTCEGKKVPEITRMEKRILLESNKESRMKSRGKQVRQRWRFKEKKAKEVKKGKRSIMW